MSIEAMKQALEALEYIHQGANNQGPHTGISWRCASNKAEPAITSLRQAIEQAEKQEPVAWLSRRYVDNFPASGYETAQPTDYGAFPVYTTPQPQREWVGLTHDEQGRIWNAPENFERAMNFAIAIEAKLKEKNI